MKWSPTQKVVCAGCGGSFVVPTPDLLSLQAICPGCGTSLAGAGEEQLKWYAGYCREIDLFFVGYELQQAGVDLSDGEVEAAQSLEDLAGAVAGCLPQSADREARAAEIVTDAARRFAPRLLDGADYAQRVIQQESAWWSSRRGGEVEPPA